MMTKNKYLIYSFIFIASITVHSYADHHDHFSFEEEQIKDCQACEENVDIKGVGYYSLGKHRKNLGVKESYHGHS